MKIIVITPVYPSKNAPVGTTSVVHYFTREWVRMGHTVTVFHVETKYPFYIYWATKLFEKKLNSKLGFLVSTKSPKAYNEILDGVNIRHVVIKKFMRSPRYKKSEIEKADRLIDDYCKINGAPDIFVGHWPSPQLEILNYLKKQYPSSLTALVFHSFNRDLNVSFPHELKNLCDELDIIGFRNPFAREEFKVKYFNPKRTFIASSGINELFLRNSQSKSFNNGINDFIYIGALIHRKHPTAIVSALAEVYEDNPYKVTFVGEGKEASLIREQFEQFNKNGIIEFTGRIDRTKVIDYLKQSEVFVMVSENETFGLVYLEAMSLGCITIASKGGGVDGIIEDGVNGFLCNPGDVKDLTRIIRGILKLSKEELQTISKNAVTTAKEYTDQKVAEKYLNAVIEVKYKQHAL